MLREISLMALKEAARNANTVAVSVTNNERSILKIRGQTLSLNASAVVFRPRRLYWLRYGSSWPPVIHVALLKQLLAFTIASMRLRRSHSPRCLFVDCHPVNADRHWQLRWIGKDHVIFFSGRSNAMLSEA